MRLRFELPPTMQDHLDRLVTLKRLHEVAGRDAPGVASILRLRTRPWPLADGEFRVTPGGTALLVGMADAELRPIAP